MPRCVVQHWPRPMYFLCRDASIVAVSISRLGNRERSIKYFPNFHVPSPSSQRTHTATETFNFTSSDGNRAREPSGLNPANLTTLSAKEPVGPLAKARVRGFLASDVGPGVLSHMASQSWNVVSPSLSILSSLYDWGILTPLKP